MINMTANEVGQTLAMEAIRMDSNIDTIQQVLVLGEDLDLGWEVVHVDIPRDVLHPRFLLLTSSWPKLSNAVNKVIRQAEKLLCLSPIP
jgi:hypothetical protein